MVLRSPMLAPIAAGAAPVYTSTLWGPTCDSADCVYKDVPLPLLRNGDWLCFPNAGAYTVAGACDFNGIGMTTPRLFYVYSDHMAGREHVQAEAANTADDIDIV
jgi:ornithine decarboxylase